MNRAVCQGFMENILGFKNVNRMNGYEVAKEIVGVMKCDKEFAKIAKENGIVLFDDEFWNNVKLCLIKNWEK